MLIIEYVFILNKCNIIKMSRMNDNNVYIEPNDEVFTLRNTNFSFGNQHRRDDSNPSNNEYTNEYDKLIQMKEMNMYIMVTQEINRKDRRI